MNRRGRVGGGRIRTVGIVVVCVVVGVLNGCSGRSEGGRPHPTTSVGSSVATSSATSSSGSTIPADCGAAKTPVRLVPEVLDERPHDPTAFTEGLLLVDDVLYESTGLQGASSVRAVDSRTGKVLDTRDLSPSSFGEGLTTLGPDRLVQLTWKEGRAFVWNRSDLRQVGEFRYSGEGWGITTLDDGRLVMSDGSAMLTVRDPRDFSVLERWSVTRADGPVDMLNELEWDGEHLWANRWKTDEIVRIDLRCHRVDAVVDAVALRRRVAVVADRPIDVLNGIAHEPGSDRFLVTGKNWPTMFEVRFVPVR